MTRKPLAIIAAALALLDLGLFYWAPHILLARVRAAAERGDAAAVSAFVDFTALRDSLKVTMASKLQEHTQGDQGAMGQLGAAFGGAFVDRLVDALVTPESVALILQGQKVSLSPQDYLAPTFAEPQVTMGYEGFSTFAVDFRQPGDPDTFSVLLSRDGLSWKLTGVRLP